MAINKYIYIGKASTCLPHSVADPDPGSGAFLTPGSGIQDEQKTRIRIRDDKPNHISESSETIFELKYLNSLMRIWDGKNLVPGSGMEKIRIKDKHPGSIILLPHIEKKGKGRVECNAVLADEGGVPLKPL
jgi:hypothetical protein